MSSQSVFQRNFFISVGALYLAAAHPRKDFFRFEYLNPYYTFLQGSTKQICTRGKIAPMSEILVSMSGLGSYTLDLSIVDGGEEPDSTEVWRAVFNDQEGGSHWEVYFEMTPDYEVWDLIDEAITAYRETIEEVD